MKLIPLAPIVVEAFSEYPSLARFVIRDMKITVSVGIVESVEKKPLKIYQYEKFISQIIKVQNIS